MKNTICGFNQEAVAKLKKTVTVKVKGEEKAKEIKIDCIDLIILRWFVDFFPKMSKVCIDDVQYAWIKYEAVLEDIPILDIKKQALADRLKKMSDFGILIHKTVKTGGTYSYYAFGDMYIKLIETEKHQDDNKNNTGDSEYQDTEGEYSNTEGVCSEIHNGEYSNTDPCVVDYATNNLSTKDLSTKDNKKKNNKKKDHDNIIDENFEILWKKLKPTRYDKKSKVSKKRKKELYDMGNRAVKAIDVYLATQDPNYYHKRDNFLNEIIDNFLDKDVSDFDKPKQAPKQDKSSEYKELWGGGLHL